MNYSILIYESPAGFAARNAPEAKDLYGAIMQYLHALKEAGVFVTGAGLESPDTATTLRYREGQRLVQDGPYADTKEQLAGFFMIDVPNRDTALDWANRCPQWPDRVIELRPNLPPRE